MTSSDANSFIRQRHRALERLGFKRRAESKLVGKFIDGQWRIDSCIGRGAFGRVYMARDRHTGERVAIKIFSEAFVNSGYLQELGLMFNEQHPNIVRTISFGYTSGRKYIVSEFVSGGTLRDFLVRSKRVGPSTAIAITREVVTALEFAHGRNVVHRDLKPENLLLTRDTPPFSVKLCDFGLSTRFSDGQKLNSSFGSPAYMAPEQFDGDYDWRVDFYAVGVILYEMLFGHRPFSGDASSISYAHKHHEISLPRSGPRVLSDLLKQLLAKEPSERFHSATALLEALDACSESIEHVEGNYRLSPPRRSQRTYRRRWVANLPKHPTAYGLSCDGELLIHAAHRLICVAPEGQFAELMRPERHISEFIDVHGWCAEERAPIIWREDDQIHILRDHRHTSWSLHGDLESTTVQYIASPKGTHLLGLTPRHVYLWDLSGELLWRAEIETYGMLPPACFSEDGSLVWVATEAPRTQLLGITLDGEQICRTASPEHDIVLCPGPKNSVILGGHGKHGLYRLSRDGFIEARAQATESIMTLLDIGSGRFAVSSMGHLEFFETESLHTRALVDIPSPQDLMLFTAKGAFQISDDDGSSIRIHYHALSR